MRFSIFSIKVGDSAELQERTKRRLSTPSGFSLRRATESWWMVGTHEYHVGLKSRTVRQKDIGLNLSGTITVPPLRKVARVEATNPCTWNRGITQRDLSCGVRR